MHFLNPISLSLSVVVTLSLFHTHVHLYLLLTAGALKRTLPFHSMVGYKLLLLLLLCAPQIYTLYKLSEVEKKSLCGTHNNNRAMAMAKAAAAVAIKKKNSSVSNF